jgi:putative redox protein
MQFQRLRFTNPQGHQLAARLDWPLDEKPAGFAIFAHCFTCTKNLKAVVNINSALAREGLAVLRFDFTGLGESEGDFAATNFTTNVADLVAAAEYLRRHFAAPKLLIGHSLGGAAVLQAAAQIPSCVAVATIAAPADPAHVLRLPGSTRAEVATAGETTLALGGQTFKITRQFLEDLEAARMEETIRELRRALLVCHSPIDNIVGIENAGRIFRAARHPKSFLSLDGADHLLSKREDSLYVGTVMAAWARKYLGLVRGEVEESRDLVDNRVTVRTGKVGYHTEIHTRGHHLVADEPIAMGGADSGPTPYDYLTAALGACTAMTLRMYADRKGLPVDAITVRLRHDKIHAAECRECATKEGKIDQIEREIELQGELDASQRERILEIADRCPVHRTLHSEIHVTSRLKE